MTATFDLLLCGALLWSAWRALSAPDLTRAVVMFIVFGLLMTLTWTRLNAPDIAIAEAAIGAGLTGALLLDTLGSPGINRRKDADPWMKHPAIMIATLVAGALLGTVTIGLPDPEVRLAPLVMEHLDQSGVAHPVTAVLLNFRGYDTLLEIAVLLAALFGLLAVAGRNGQMTAVRQADPLLETAARLITPMMVLIAGYLLWAGAHRPGGAFQAGAVLAGAMVLLHIVRIKPAWTSPGTLLRVGISGGFLVFLVVAAGPLIDGNLLHYPQTWAGTLILAIETSLTLSLGLILGGLFLFLTSHPVRS